MEFIIINRGGNQFFGHDGYEAWPEKLHNKNSRSFKKGFDRIKYEKIQIYWAIDNYIGPAKPRTMTFFSFGTKRTFVIPEISITTVTKHLNDVQIIDDYIPNEGDELRIWRGYRYTGIKALQRPTLEMNTISLIYKNGKWNEGNYEWESDETMFAVNGLVNM